MYPYQPMAEPEPAPSPSADRPSESEAGPPERTPDIASGPRWLWPLWNQQERRPRAGWRILLQFGVMLGLAIGIDFGLPKSLKEAAKTQSHAVSNLIATGVQGGLIVASVWFAARCFDRRRFSGLGLRLNRQWWVDCAAGVLIGFAMMGGLVAVTALAWGANESWQGFELDEGPSAWMAGLIMLTIWSAVAFYEELFSRGYQMTNLVEGFAGLMSPRWAGGLAVALTASLFGALHLTNPHATWLAAGSIVSAGALLGLAYIWTGSLGLSIGLHFGWNFSQGCIFGLPVSGAGSFYSLMRWELHAPEIWTGGAFGPEGGLSSIIAVGVGVLLVRAWSWKRRPLDVHFRSRASVPNQAA